MIVVENTHHHLHDPYWKFVLGKHTYEVKDVPSRMHSIKSVLSKDPSFKFLEAKAFSENNISIMHPYFNFIKETSQNIVDPEEELYPDLFPGEGANLPTKMDPLWAGLYCTDCVTPITKNTYKAAKGSVDACLTAAELLVNNSEKVVYAMTRPSGHHAGPRIFGGYCYFNNAAVVANFLSEYGKVAILDIDYHHGNGTQEFFTCREDILTCSIHGHPQVEYPYFWGYADESPQESALKSNFNLPLMPGADNTIYLDAIDKIVQVIQSFNPAYFVISAGFDTFIDDPIGGFKLTTDAYFGVGEKLGMINVPTIICQEGGYNLHSLGDNVYSFLKAFKDRVTPI